MSDLVKELRASVNLDAVHGDPQERMVCANQMARAAIEIERLRERVAELEALPHGITVTDVWPARPSGMTAVDWELLSRLRDDAERREGMMNERWCETIELGILSIGREWDESACQCDASVGCVPCHYCAEHSAIMAGEKMLDEIERLQLRVGRQLLEAGGDA